MNAAVGAVLWHESSGWSRRALNAWPTMHAPRPVSHSLAEPMTIVLIRHGETALNAARVLQPADTPLSATGRHQSEALGRRVAGLAIAAIVSSDLPRAWQTAELLSAATGVPVTADPMLHERNFGELRGRPYDTLGFDPLAMDAAPAGGESAAAFAQRAADAFDVLVRTRERLHGTLAVVTHGLLIRAMLEARVALAPCMQMPGSFGNTSLTVVSARPPHTALLLACTSHLDPAARAEPHRLGEA